MLECSTYVCVCVFVRRLLAKVARRWAALLLLIITIKHNDYIFSSSR